MKLPRLDSLIILVFFGCVGIWGISKCSSQRSEIGNRLRTLSDEESEDRPVRRDTVVLAPKPQPQSTPTQTPATPAPTQPAGQRPVVTSAPQPSATTPKVAPTTQNKTYSTLYVTIDGLKLRKEPNLKAELVAKLDLYEQVYFLNQKTEKAEEINLGYEKVTDHWVKVRTKAGKEGWVFGAGVHYYKMKRKGVME